MPCGVGTLLASGLAAGAAEPEFRDWLAHDWHEVEVVVFLHRSVDTREEIIRFDPRRLPLPLTSFDPPPPAWRWPADKAAGDEGIPAKDVPFPPAWLWMDDPALISIPDVFPDADVPDAPPAEDEVAEIPQLASLPPPPPSRTLVREAFAAFEEALVRASMQWRTDGLSLTPHVNRMRRSSSYDVLHHARWFQAMARPANAVPVLLQLEPDPNGLHRIEGTLRASRGLFVEIDARVWLHEDPPDAEAITPDGPGYAELSETRRMRTGDIHYLDHPRLGLVVRAQRLKVPAALADLVEGVEEGR